jgi:hypothetical protein
MKVFLVVLFLFISCFCLIPVLGHKAHEVVGYLIFFVFVVLLPILALTGKDALVYLSENSKENQYLSIGVKVIAGVPVIIFGALSLIIGISIIIWVIFNLFVERLPEFTGGMFSGLGIGPALIYFGISSLKTIWIKKQNA